MLTYFPTPYPDELWYSVLCRYHIRSGNAGSATTFRELLDGREKGTLSSFLPNIEVKQVIDRLPEDFMNFEDVALNHTLFKYAFRMKPLETKKKLLNTAQKGMIHSPISYRKGLKFCPICKKEDEENYGEDYWHLSHQIPHVKICHKHNCRLKMYPVKATDLNNNFIFLSLLNEDIDVADDNVAEAEVKLTQRLTQYLNLPLETGPREEYNNLYEGILKAGYKTSIRDKDFIDYRRLGEELHNMFGEKLVEEYFGEINLQKNMDEYIRYWKYKSPEKYAMLAVFIGQSPQETFDNTKIESRIKEALKILSNTGMIFSKKYIAEQLDLKEGYLDMVANNLGIVPFWEYHFPIQKTKPHKVELEVKFEDSTNLLIFNFPSYR